MTNRSKPLLRLFALLFAAIAVVPASAQILYAKKVVAPSYPELPRTAEIQGTVPLELSVKNGHVQTLHPLGGPPQLAFSKVINYALQWEFSSDCPDKILVLLEFILLPYETKGAFNGTESSYVEFLSPNIVKIVAKKIAPTPPPVLQ